jgi:hypothetical protein
MKTERAQEGIVQETGVALRRAIGPDKRQDNAAQQRNGELSKKIDSFFHNQRLCFIAK